MTHLVDKKSDISTEAFASLGAPEIVYIREISVEDLHDEMSDDFGTSGMNEEAFEEQFVTIEPGTKLYALHAANWVRMAVVDSSEAAYVAARQYELTPVSVD